MPFASQQDYAYKNIRSSAVLTNAYVASTVLSDKSPSIDVAEISLRNQLVLYIGLTLGNLADAEVKIEFSHDGTTYYQETFSAVGGVTSTESLGEHKFTGTGNYRLALPIKDRFIKVSAKGTGDVTNSLMAVEAVYGVV